MTENLYDRYCRIRDNAGYKDADVASGTQITKSTFSDWKCGRYTPKQQKLQKIANFLNVSFDYLMTGNETEQGYYLKDETAKAAQEIFENKELRMLFDVQRDMEPDDLRALHSMALALKKKERGYNDDTGC